MQIKDTCVSCGHPIIRGTYINPKNRRDYYNMHGNYCVECCQKAANKMKNEHQKTKDQLLKERRNKLITEWGGHNSSFRR